MDLKKATRAELVKEVKRLPAIEEDLRKFKEVTWQKARDIQKLHQQKDLLEEENKGYDVANATLRTRNEMLQDEVAWLRSLVPSPVQFKSGPIDPMPDSVCTNFVSDYNNQSTAGPICINCGKYQWQHTH